MQTTNTEMLIETPAAGSTQTLERRLLSIDMLRGLAALAVVVVHADASRSGIASGNRYLDPVFAVIWKGYLGVPLFFVISGFCIHLRWAKGYATSGVMPVLSYRAFWMRRLRRLYPPYVVALCICMAVVVTAWVLRLNVPLVTVYPNPKPAWMMGDFIAHLTMLHGLIPRFDHAAGNPAFWTLSREEYFYLLYLVLLPFRKAVGIWKALASVFVLGLAFSAAVSMEFSPASTWWSVLNSSALVLWIQWCLGMAAVESYYGIVRLPHIFRSGWSLIPLTIISLAAERWFYMAVPVLWGLTFFTMINSMVEAEKEHRLIVNRFTKWLAGVGVFSYSLYLIHFPIRAAMAVALGSATRAGGGRPLLYLLCVLLMSACGYAGGKVFFFLVERHFVSPVVRTKNDDTLLQPQVRGTEDLR